MVAMLLQIPLALCYPSLMLMALLALFIEKCGVWCLNSEAQVRFMKCGATLSIYK